MFLKSSKGNINLSTLLITFLICIAIALGVALFHHYNTPSKYLEYKVSDISDKLVGVSNFPKTANNMLNSDKEVSYIKLLDRNGVLEESFGNDTLGNTKKFTINGPKNKTIVLGLIKPTNIKLDTYLLVWSLLIGTSLSLFLIFIVFMKGTISGDKMKKLEGAMDRITQGDYSGRIEVDTASVEDVSTLNIYQSFNRMAESLNNKYETEEIIEEGAGGIEPEYMELSDGNGEEIAEVESEDMNKLNAMDETGSEVQDVSEGNIVFDEINGNAVGSEPQIEEVEFDLNAETEDEEIFSEQDSEVLEENAELSHGKDERVSLDTIPVDEISEEDSSFKPKIVLPQTSVYPKNRNVTVMVAKIDNFEILTQNLDSSDLNSFLTKYRKSASQIISSYGGVIEALLQDEIVAIFNAPDEQNNPELRALCSAVEILHELATMAKQRRSDGKELIAGKIGVGVQSLSYYSETGVPDSVKKVIKDARYVCENANLWKVYVTSDLYNLVNENVDAKEFLIDGEILYSITSVEQGVVERDNFS